MDEIFEKILLNGYGLKLYSAQRTRTCLICNTSGGIMALKKQPFDSLMISFEAEGRNTLIKNGFKGINGFIPSSDGIPYYTYSEQNYTLEPYVELETPDMEDTDTVFEAVKTLALMHNAACGLEFEKGRSALGRLPQMFEKRISELKHIRKDIARRGEYDIMDMIVKTHYSYFVQRAESALNRLNESGYGDIVKQAEEKRTFCHNSYKSGGFMFDKDRNIVIESMPKLAYDIPEWDIAFFLRQMMKMPDFDADYTLRILDTYGKYTDFDKNNESVVKAVLLFPWKFMSLCNEYYNKKRNYCLKPAAERFQRCIEASMNEEKILSRI